MNSAVRRFRNLLSEQGYRVTPQRLAIYEALAGSRKHPSAEELYSQVKKRYPMISPATVYNTLQLLVNLGLATELGFHGETRYDGNPDTHANILCVRCRRIFDVDIDGLGDLQEELTRKSRFVVLGQRHEFFGICPHCGGVEDAGDEDDGHEEEVRGRPQAQEARTGTPSASGTRVRGKQAGT